MYKIISISSNMQEMMIPLKSLPVCAIVFNKVGHLIEINQPALNFLKIKTKDDFRAKRLKVLNDSKYLVSIIKELKTGKIVQNEIFKLIYPDSVYAVISFNACMLNGITDVFIFQFFEVSVSAGKALPKQKIKSTKGLQNISKAKENNHRIKILTSTSAV